MLENLSDVDKSTLIVMMSLVLAGWLLLIMMVRYTHIEKMAGICP